MCVFMHKGMYASMYGYHGRHKGQLTQRALWVNIRSSDIEACVGRVHQKLAYVPRTLAAMTHETATFADDGDTGVPPGAEGACRERFAHIPFIIR